MTMAMCIKNVLIQFFVVLVFFGLMISDAVTTNLIIFRTCYLTLGYNKSACALLGRQSDNNITVNLERLVQPHAATIRMLVSLIEASSCAIICLFIGPWSDKFGRKPLLIIPSVGFTLGFILFTIFSSLPNLSPWYSLVCVIPIMLTGGMSTYITGALCYITDITSEENRGINIALFEGALGFGVFLGSLLSSYAYNTFNYAGVFAISAICYLVAAVLAIFCIPESVTNRQREGKLNGFFQFTHIIDMTKTSFRKRDNYDRGIILCSIVMLTIFIIIVNGEGTVNFLYLRERFHWYLRKYTVYNSVCNVIWILGAIVGVYVLSKVMKIVETVLILIAFISMLNGSLLKGLSVTDLGIYAGAAVGCLGGVLSPMMRSFVSKFVSSEDTGKIFALIVISESLFGMMGGPLYTLIYNSTININSAIFNYVTAGFYIVEILLTLIVIIMNRYTVPQMELLEQSQSHEEMLEESS